MPPQQGAGIWGWGPWLVLLAGCHPKVTPSPCPPEAWAAVPLQPALHVDEPGRSNIVTVLLLDRHSGAPISHGVVRLSGTVLQARPSQDGIATISQVPEGRYLAIGLALGYIPFKDSVVVTAADGRIRVFQLRRMGHCLQETVSGPSVPPGS